MTTTDLRTKATKLVEALKNGETVSLIHRSRVIGKIAPADEGKPFDVEAFTRLVADLKLPKTTDKQREKMYRAHMLQKYGKDISRR